MEPAQENMVPFEHLPLAKADTQSILSGVYRVYIDATHYSCIQASSALEALEMSGMRHAFKIERENLFSTNLLNPKSWSIPQTDIDTVPAAVEAAEPVAATQPAMEEAAPAEHVAEATTAESAPAEAAEPEAALSQDEIEKLLNS